MTCTRTTLPLLQWGRQALKLSAMLAIGLGCGLSIAGKKPYDYYVTGNPDAPVLISAQPSTPSLVLMGGGPDVDEAFR